VQAQAELERTDVGGPHRQRPWRGALSGAGLILGGLLFCTALAAYLADLSAHTSVMIDWYDLNVYNDAGLITREFPSILYTWELKVGVQFTYTPFAAIVFAGGSLMPLTVLRWLMTIMSLISVPLTAWLTLGGMGRRGAGRAGGALAVGAIALWTEPVVKALFLGQIELVLMLLVVWDLTRQDRRWFKGAGIGIAAGIKLIPLIFIPYLLLSGKIRQAAVATAAFAATVGLGFVILPGPSASYWLTGYFMRPGRTGGVDSLVNQSLLGMIARQTLDVRQAQSIWLPVAIAVAVAGLAGGTLLTRANLPVQGWVLVGTTAVLVSPISWDHHWVWIIPVLTMLAGLAMKAGPAARTACIAAIIAIAGVMGSWPWKYSGPQAYVPRRGLLGWFVKPPQVTNLGALHGWDLLTWNLFVAVGAVIYLALLGSAWPAWRRRARSAPPGPEPPGAEPTSPIGSLLARADAALRGSGAAAAREPARTGQ